MQRTNAWARDFARIKKHLNTILNMNNHIDNQT